MPSFDREERLERVMDCLWIEGGARLSGRVEVPPAKNAALPLMCLSLLTHEEMRFSKLPQVADIRSLSLLLSKLGVKQKEPGCFQASELISTRADYELVRKMRASILVLGPLLARAGQAEVSLPGGCAIGERPVDIHLEGLKALGAEIEIEAGYIRAKAKRLRGADFRLHFPSVTGTINLVMAASLAEGETQLRNVALEPEVQEVCEVLNRMGAKISGIGGSELRIQGVSQLQGTSWSIQPDRIQLITFLAAAAITGGSVQCHPYRKNSIDAVVQKFSEMGCHIRESQDEIHIERADELHPIEIQTAPFPDFPTDGQAQFVACLTLANPEKGLSRVRERVFENRFQHVSELRRMGAMISLNRNLASIRGVPRLSGATVMASDLRASASLVLAGLGAEGKTQLLRVYHLDRGYENFESKLQALGAKLWRSEQ